MTLEGIKGDFVIENAVTAYDKSGNLLGEGKKKLRFRVELCLDDYVSIAAQDLREKRSIWKKVVQFFTHIVVKANVDGQMVKVALNIHSLARLHFTFFQILGFRLKNRFTRVLKNSLKSPLYQQFSIVMRNYGDIFAKHFKGKRAQTTSHGLSRKQLMRAVKYAYDDTKLNSKVYQIGRKTLILSKKLQSKGNCVFENDLYITHRKFDRVLGKGGYKNVYEMYEYRTNQKIAVAFPNSGKESDFQEDYQNEMNIQNKLSDVEGVMPEPICEVKLTDGELYAVLLKKYTSKDYSDGLMSISSNGEVHGFKNLNDNQRLNIFRRLANIVHKGHQNKVIFGDIKPNNMSSDPGGDISDAILFDYGGSMTFSDVLKIWNKIKHKKKIANHSGKLIGTFTDTYVLAQDRQALKDKMESIQKKKVEKFNKKTIQPLINIRIGMDDFALAKSLFQLVIGKIKTKESGNVKYRKPHLYGMFEDSKGEEKYLDKTKKNEELRELFIKEMKEQFSSYDKERVQNLTNLILKIMERDVESRPNSGELLECIENLDS